MKHKFITLLLVVATAATTYYCTSTYDASGISSHNCTDEEFYGITLQEFVNGVSKYGRTRSRIINPTLPRMGLDSIRDARACWYSLDTLKKFICLIEKFSHLQGLRTDSLGIRFYYAVYPEDGPHVRDMNYRDRHTLFMVPTYRDSIHNIDFDPRLSYQNQIPLGSYLSIRRMLDSLKSFSGARIMMIGALFDSPNMYENQGQLCPPACPEPVTSLLETIDRIE
jgi:hypothetical protein